MAKRPLLALALLLHAVTARADPWYDGFDAGYLDGDRWNTAQIAPAQIEFARPGRCGPAALALTARTGEGLGDCGGEGCQRLEIREQERRTFGEDVWYAFSFRITGDIAANGSDRWIIGQWKEETDHSPFLAQRFDNGVFHITVQDGETRRLVAAAEGDPDRITAFHDAVALLGPERSAHLSAISRGLRALNALSARKDAPRNTDALDAILPPDLSGMTFGALNQFSFLSDVDLFARPSNIVVKPGTHPVLPDPKKDWVDMRYHIRGGLNGAGLVEVWANGNPVVTVSGDIGHADRKGPTQYFKMGHYRKAAPGTVTVVFDEFRRGSSAAEVAGVCGR